MEASTIEVTQHFNKDMFKENLFEIRKLTTQKPQVFVKEMKRLCAESGIILVFIPEFEGTYISGATRWLTPEKALIIMSLRHKTNDHFWFTFFHEAGHVLLHSKKNVFIDNDNPKGFESKEEEEANRFAANYLIPELEYTQFINTKRFTQKDIEAFAKKVGIHPSILVGRLQREKKIPYSWLNGLKEHFEWKNK